MPTTNPTTRRVQLSTELVLGALTQNQFMSFMGAYLRSLPAWIDDAERDFGLDIYSRMLKDPTISSSMNAVKTAILSKGPRFVNRVKSPSTVNPDPGEVIAHERGEEIRAWVERVMDRLQSPIEDILWEMLDYPAYGHAVAEQVYDVSGAHIVLRKLRVKPREAYGFVVDRFMDLYGLVAASAGSSSAAAQSIVSNESVILREKFWVMSFAPEHGDPRGTSILRAAYNSWYLKQQTWPAYLKFLMTFATPSIIVYAPPDGAAYIELGDAAGNAVLDSDGLPIQISVEESILQKIIAFANGTAVVLPHGAKHELIQSEGDGAAYIKAFDLFDRQMTRAILISARAVMEAEHGSKADTQNAQDISGLFAQYIARQVEMSFERDVIAPLVRYNWGDDAAENLCPKLVLTTQSAADLAAFINATANLARSQPGFIDPSQFVGFDELFGFPVRDWQSQLQAMTQEKEMRADRELMMSGVFPDMEALAGGRKNMPLVDDGKTDK